MMSPLYTCQICLHLIAHLTHTLITFLPYHPHLENRYKCPKCRSPFCCVQCSKDHKANHCPATKSNNETGDDDVSKQQQSDNTAAAATSTAVAKVGSSSAATEPQSKYLPAAAFAQAASSLPKKKRKRRPAHDDDDSDNDEPGWNITAEMKQLVQRSEWLRKELEDGGLRHLIEQIDAASDDDDDDGEEDNNSNKRKKNWGRNGQHNNKNGNTDISQRVLALARTKHSHPKFASFIDRLLVTAGVLVDGGGGNGEASLFEGGGGGGGGLGESGRLELVPVPRRGGELIAAAGGKVESRSADEDSGSDEESDSSSDEDDSDGSSAE